MHHLKLIYGNNISIPSAYLITRWGKIPLRMDPIHILALVLRLKTIKTWQHLLQINYFLQGKRLAQQILAQWLELMHQELPLLNLSSATLKTEMGNI